MYFDTERRKSGSAEEQVIKQLEDIPKLTPKFNVVLIDDNDHTYDYVIEMLADLFGYTKLESFEMACEVDYKGRVVVLTTDRDQAENKKQQILNYGPDWRLTRSKGSMNAVIEPAE